MTAIETIVFICSFNAFFVSRQDCKFNFFKISFVRYKPAGTPINAEIVAHCNPLNTFSFFCKNSC